MQVHGQEAQQLGNPRRLPPEQSRRSSVVPMARNTRGEARSPNGHAPSASTIAPIWILGRYLLRRSVQRARTPRLPPAPRRDRRSRGSHRRDRQRAAPRVVARLQRGRRPDPRAGRPRRRPTRASRSWAPRARSPRSPSTPRPTSSSSPVARSSSATEMRRLAWDLEHEDVQVVVAPSVTDVSSERVSVRPVAGLPLVHLESRAPRTPSAGPSAPSTSSARSACCCCFAPLLLFAAVRDQAPRPRPGAVPPDPGRPRRRDVPLLKFRSMVTDAEALLADLHAKHGLRAAACSRWPTTRAITPPGKLAAPVLDRRAAPAVQRAPRRDEPGRPAPAAAARGRAATTTTWPAGCASVPA